MGSWKEELGKGSSEGPPIVKDANSPIFRPSEDLGVAELQAVDHASVLCDGLEVNKLTLTIASELTIKAGNISIPENKSG